MNYDGKVFRVVSDNPDGDVDQDTLFYYNQMDDYIWGHYSGGQVIRGVLIGKIIENDELSFNYMHYSLEGRLRQGFCHSVPEILENGKVRLLENWSWTGQESGSGVSLIEEIIFE